MQSGILLPIFSLPSKYGIGSFGKEAFDFIDFLSESKQKIWQILPLNQTSYGDSPYQSPSAFAGNPYFIDLESLQKEHLITVADLKAAERPCDSIDYGSLFCERYKLLEKAFARFLDNIPSDYADFCKSEQYWLDDYAIFMAIKKENGYVSREEWNDELSLCKNKSKLRSKYSDVAEFWKFLQYKFTTQYMKVKSYANSKGIKIMGDMPIYVALDSADVWANSAEFCLNEAGRPTDVAGVPPDYFSEAGQLWGNPLYDWNHMKENGYKWWKLRLKSAFKMYDIVRIDHFRAFYNYYAIPYGSVDARIGEWRMGPGIEFFNEMKRYFKKAQIVAEDLGFLDEGVHEMLKLSGYPGMKVLQFAFDSDDNPYLPENHIENSIVYTGTHDNDTLCGWLKSASEETLARVEKKIPRRKNQSLADAIIRAAHASVAETSIIPMQDYLELESEARINIPSTNSGNWQWRLPRGYAKKQLSMRIAAMMDKYHR